MATQQLSLPIQIPVARANGQQHQLAADNVPAAAATARFPHTRAFLASLARQHKPTTDDDETNDDPQRVPGSLVASVAGLLDEENEDELKDLLKETYGLDEEKVSSTAFMAAGCC